MTDPRAALHDLSLLQFMSAAERTLIVDSFVPGTFEFGQTIVRQGDAADGFYVVVTGTARVLKEAEDGQEIALNVVRPGESFGEMALLEETTRTATVRATTEVTVLKLDRAVFHDLVHNHPAIRARLELQVKHRHLHNFFRVYSAFARLPVDALRLLVTELDAVEVPAGTLVMREGEEAGPMYIVQHGRLRAFRRRGRSPPVSALPSRGRLLRRGVAPQGRQAHRQRGGGGALSVAHADAGDLRQTAGRLSTVPERDRATNRSVRLQGRGSCAARFCRGDPAGGDRCPREGRRRSGGARRGRDGGGSGRRGRGPVEPTKDRSRVVLVRDLAPRKDVTGGSGKLLFGERQDTAEEPPKQPKPGER
jgi:CRP-like cAMP-binding protein